MNKQKNPSPAVTFLFLNHNKSLLESPQDSQDGLWYMEIES
jgi:hypothetical protein